MIKGVEWQKMKRDVRRKVGGSVNKRERKKYLDLWASGLSEGQIARKFKRDVRTIRKYLDDPIKAELMIILGPCLTNPHVKIPNRDNQSPLELNGQNWRLDPITWFHLCTPDFSEESEAYWRTDFTKLKKKMEKAHFWQDYQNLRTKIAELQKEFEKAIDKLSIDQRKIWERIQEKRRSVYPPSRTAESPEEDWKDWRHSDDYSAIEEVVTAMHQVIPDLDERFCELEELLQKLNDDLIENQSGK